MAYSRQKTSTGDPPAQLPVLVPPDAFGLIEPGIYRTNIFDRQNFGFIAQLNLKAVVFLSMELASRSLRTFLKQNNIRLIRLGFTCWKADKTWKPVNEAVIKEGLEWIMNSEKHPLLIMCTSGAHETGSLVGCLRKLQGWSLSCILDEYNAFAGARARASDEQFIEIFDVDLVTLPRHLPSWFSPNSAEINIMDIDCKLVSGEKKLLGGDENVFMALPY